MVFLVVSVMPLPDQFMSCKVIDLHLAKRKNPAGPGPISRFIFARILAGIQPQILLDCP